MRTVSLGLLGAAGAIALAGLVPSDAAAQALGPGEWQSRVTVYGWLPGITGAQQKPNGEPAVDLDSVNVLDMLDSAFFLTGETRRDKVGFLFDFEYAKLSQHGEWLRERLETEVKTEITMTTAAVTYRLYDDPAAGRFIDGFGGARVYDADVSFSIDSRRFGRSIGADANWVDAIVGLRGETALGRGFSVSGYADAGGFGWGASSNLTWEVYGGVNYDFNDRFRALLGYRYMSIDYEGSSLSMDVDMYGPILGLGVSF